MGMTERERREQGLSPTPAQLARYEYVQKENEEALTAVAEPAVRSLTIFAESMQSTFRAVQTAMEPFTRMQEQIARAASYYKNLDESMRRISMAMDMPKLSPTIFSPAESVHYVPEREQRPISVRIELTERHCEMIGGSVATALIERGAVVHVYTTTAQIDLRYDRKRRFVSRTIDTLERTACFDGKEDNKRRDLFERLIRTKHPIDTTELIEALNCPSVDATYKVVQGLNKKLADDLGLTMNFADGSDKGGYHVHAAIAVHEI